MTKFLFDEFKPVSAATWKQKIQVDLKGKDYNDTLRSKTNEGITINPFYTKEDQTNHKISVPKKGYLICQTIFIDDEKIANTLAKNALERGATSIQFRATKPFDPKTLLKGFPGKTPLYFSLSFFDVTFKKALALFCDQNNTFIQTDIIGHLAETGNWFQSLQQDFGQLDQLVKEANYCITISGDLYQNAGANCTQQLAYTLAHANEYLNRYGKEVASKISFNFAVSSNYFFEIAKLRAFRLLWDSLLNEYDTAVEEAHIFVQPSHRNKTIYDYNVNMLRTTSECMSAILGGANTISNISYDTLYQKSNEFGERIARNQLLILQQESYLSEAQNIADGTYYIEKITAQLAENALPIFKSIEKAGGFLKQLKEGTIQRKITENAEKEAADFKAKKTVLLGTNLQVNSTDKMKENIALYPFVKKRNIKTLISPIVRKRLAETIEKARLENE